jgi:hypothetical protein
MPTLKNCTIRFHTNDEDKDHDSHVTVTVRDRDNRIAARIDSDFGHFDDQSDNGPFGLMIRNPSTYEALSAGNFTIRIDPNGHDTWRFNAYLDLYFNDGSHMSGEENQLSLSQNNREQTFGLEGFNYTGPQPGNAGGPRWIKLSRFEGAVKFRSTCPFRGTRGFIILLISNGIIFMPNLDNPWGPPKPKKHMKIDLSPYPAPINKTAKTLVKAVDSNTSEPVSGRVMMNGQFLAAGLNEEFTADFSREKTWTGIGPWYWEYGGFPTFTAEADGYETQFLDFGLPTTPANPDGTEQGDPNSPWEPRPL